MGLLNRIFTKSPQDHERKGDVFYRTKVWGQAKIEYESALYKLEKKSVPRTDDVMRLREKLGRSTEALALSHKRDGEEMMDSDCFEEALEIFTLALELTHDPDLEHQLKDLVKRAEQMLLMDSQEEMTDFYGYKEEAEEDPSPSVGDDYFLALISAMPPHIQTKYQDYGRTFREGYTALNRGEFARAAELLSKAMDEQSFPDTYIPLELATARMNLGMTEEAEELLAGFLQHHPDSLPAYNALCLIYWEKGEYDRAEALIDSCPGEIADSVEVFLLRGETLYQAARYEDTRDFYGQILERHGWNEFVARELAKVQEALGEKMNAREIYSRILSECTHCGSRPDPFVKKKYADLCLESGETTSKLLDLYLTLAQEDPGNGAEYYRKAGQICEAQGNREEARRFRLISERYEKGVEQEL